MATSFKVLQEEIIPPSLPLQTDWTGSDVSALDLINRNFFIPLAWTFRLPQTPSSSFLADPIYGHLRAGLADALSQLPIFAGRIVENGTHGRLRIQDPVGVEWKVLETNQPLSDFAAADESWKTIGEAAGIRVRPARMSAGLYANKPQTIHGFIEQRLPITTATLVWIPADNALLVSIYVSHMVADAGSAKILMDYWTNAVKRRIGDDPIPPPLPAVHIPQSYHELFKSFGAEGGPQAYTTVTPEWFAPPKTEGDWEQGEVPKGEAVVSAVFRIPQAWAARLKEAVTKKIKEASPKSSVGFVSTEDCLIAFLWKAISSAPHRDATIDSCTHRPLNMRSKFSLEPHTPGNIVLNMATHVSGGPVAAPLHEIALAHRETLVHVPWRQECGFLAGNIDKDLWFSSDIVRSGQPDLVLSSWACFGLERVDFGFGEAMDFNAEGYLGAPNVGQMLREEGDYKYQVSLMERDMESLKRLFSAWADLPESILSRVTETKRKSHPEKRRTSSNFMMALDASKLAPEQSADSTTLADTMDDYVPDWTDWGRFRTTLWKHSLSVADSVLFAALNGAVVVAAVWTGFVGFLFIGPLLQFLFPKVTRPIRIRASTTDPTQPAVRRYLPSSVSASAPTFFEDYEDVISAPNVLEDLADKLCRPDRENPGRRPPFDPVVARFFVHLSALVYENQDVVESFASSWGLRMESMEQDSCASYVFYSPAHNFVVVVCRGVSPFDLSELLVNAMMQKVQPDPKVLPGRVHEGFYNLLSWNPAEPATPPPTATVVEEETVEVPSRNACDVGELIRLIQDNVIPHISGQPAIWFTGHSLGAALSTLILSHLVHTENPLITSSFVKGAYTFGSPKCGDTDFATATAKKMTAARVVFYRVVNADDPITAFPIGGHSDGLAAAMREAHKDGLPVVCHTDYKHIGVPVVLHCDGFRMVGKDRDLEALIKNAILSIGEFLPFLGRFLRGREPLMGLAHRIFPFPHHHLPVEYNRHMG
ncbi:hypothetical protein HDU96_003166 [Phlyctochytrium bullatum]|nr:hypothetical protein HDU96_003166 [Phlyctochytrium bullatum]